MIKIDNIHKSYDNGTLLHVLKGVSLCVEKGEMVSIMGASGSGKSTLLNILGILDSYDQGSYYLAGKLINNPSEREAAILRNKMIGFIFQSFNLINYKNALDNVALPLYYRGISRKRRNIEAMELLDIFGLKDWATHMPNELSGGQKQRIAIARSLITKPEIILGDEPTGALDSQNTADVIKLLRDVNLNGMTMILVTHEREIAEKTDRIINFKDGIIDNIEDLKVK